VQINTSVTGPGFKPLRTIQINHQPDATIFQFIILTFIYSSTCFGRSAAHRQEPAVATFGLTFVSW